jgi:hypothetical protein
MWRVLFMYEINGTVKYKHSGCSINNGIQLERALGFADACSLDLRDDDSRYFVVSEEEYQSYWKDKVL